MKDVKIKWIHNEFDMWMEELASDIYRGDKSDAMAGLIATRFIYKTIWQVISSDDKIKALEKAFKENLEHIKNMSDASAEHFGHITPISQEEREKAIVYYIRQVRNIFGPSLNITYDNEVNKWLEEIGLSQYKV